MDVVLTLHLDPQSRVSPWLEPIPNPPGCSVIHNFLSLDECRDLVSRLRFPEVIDTRVNGGSREIDQQRIVDRLKETNEDFAAEIFTRLRPFLPTSHTIVNDDPELGAFSQGVWDVCGVNEMMSFYRYTPGGRFSKHRDGIYHRNEDCRSLFTVLIYLNSDYTRGRTTVYADDDSFSLEVQPEPGLAFVMLQRVLHEGKCVETGTKYAIRLDIMYQRQGEYDESRLENNQRAEEYLRLAIDFERAKNGPKAIEYYKKAFRLNPRLERLA